MAAMADLELIGVDFYIAAWLRHQMYLLIHRHQPAVAMHSSRSDQRLATALRKSSARMVHAAWLRGLPPRPFFFGTIGWGPPSAVLEARGSTHLASMLCADSPIKLPHLPPKAKT